jgi:hypothetical protein
VVNVGVDAGLLATNGDDDELQWASAVSMVSVAR